MAADVVKKLPDGMKDLPGREPRRFLAGNEIDIPCAFQSAAIASEILSCQPFHSVSLYGVADFFADRDAKPRVPLPVACKNRDKIPVLNFSAAAGQLQIFSALPDSVVF